MKKNLRLTMFKLIPKSKKIPREIWIIAFVSFVNKAGTMVVPYLSKFLNEGLNFNYSQIGIVMVFFGLGSLTGTFISGKISDKIGPYKVMFISLFLSGIVFLNLQFLTTFYSFCFGVFMLTLTSDMFRPAMMLTANVYITKQKRIEALSIIRSATNLGVILGPILGGILITFIGYKILFFIDGITCIVSILLFVFLVKEKKLLYKLKFKHLTTEKFVPFKDKSFLLHWFVAFLTGFVFFQTFTTLPIYYKVHHNLNTLNIGLLISLNGLIVFLFEYKIVKFIQKRKIIKIAAVMFGLFIISFAFLILALFCSKITLYITTILIAFGAVFTFPFASSFVMSRSYKTQEGYFMSIFQMSYSFAHVFSSYLAFKFINTYGFNFNWKLNSFLCILGSFITFVIYLIIKKERKAKKNEIINSIFN